MLEYLLNKMEVSGNMKERQMREQKINNKSGKQLVSRYLEIKAA